jgi:hypothetical protein
MGAVEAKGLWSLLHVLKLIRSLVAGTVCLPETAARVPTGNTAQTLLDFQASSLAAALVVLARITNP